MEGSTELLESLVKALRHEARALTQGLGGLHKAFPKPPAMSFVNSHLLSFWTFVTFSSKHTLPAQSLIPVSCETAKRLFLPKGAKATIGMIGVSAMAHGSLSKWVWAKIQPPGGPQVWVIVGPCLHLEFHVGVAPFLTHTQMGLLFLEVFFGDHEALRGFAPRQMRATRCGS